MPATLTGRVYIFYFTYTYYLHILPIDIYKHYML